MAESRTRARPLSGTHAVLVRVAAVAVLLAIWELLVLAEFWPPAVLPGPAAVWDQLLATADAGNGQGGYAGSTVVERLGVSLRRVGYGSAYGVLLGVGLGLLMGLVPLIRAITEPFVTFLRALPPLAYLSLLVIWFGIDEEPKVYLLMVAAFPPVAVATAAAVTGVNKQYVEAAAALGASRLRVVTTVVLPASAPEILTGIRLAVGIAYSSVVAAETVNGADGIGGMVLNAQRYNQTAVVLLGLIVIGVTGLIIDSAILAVQRALSPWRGLA
ncbi:ABC transporter permease [Actinokineospora globicatena]|uniref:ABC transporter permease n=1 Tax=Actinokineospora globicatena TaxID=103729 RepID=UPI0020A37287|nr:ABC transporter permease [Actinokineospora globicatena]MCP2303307.1 taurine transport system permease protein [Actinokineospora globicatena]GLW79563.1 putative ABC transporter, permease protein [Actinokineospora globicatena]GLW86027.1 putative ABC transporter, permease protein [Actinokineospora globicatena]